MKKKSLILTIILFLGSVFLSLGTMYIFPGCQGVKDNGDVMRCHWAENAIALIAATNAVIYLVALVIKDLKIRAGMILSTTIMNCAIIALANNIVIRLCMSRDMHCWTAMRPMVTVIACAIIIVGIIDYIFSIKGREEK